MQRFCMNNATKATITQCQASDPADGGAQVVVPQPAHVPLTLDDVTPADVTAIRAMRPITPKKLRARFRDRGATTADVRRLLRFLKERGDIVTVAQRHRELYPELYPPAEGE